MNCLNNFHSVSAVVDCGSLEYPDNGQVELSNTTFELTANYTCDLGYSLNGNSIRTCEANGNWSGDPPSCECKWLNCWRMIILTHSFPSVCAVVDCGSLQDPDNGQVGFSNTTFESTGNYTCNLGYGLNGNSIRTCEANGVWSGDPPSCECKCLKHMYLLHSFVRIVICMCVADR